MSSRPTGAANLTTAVRRAVEAARRAASKASADDSDDTNVVVSANHGDNQVSVRSSKQSIRRSTRKENE